MKTRIAAGLVCLAAALGLGAGAANAAEAPAEQSPALAGITLDMPAVDLQAPDAPASPLLPSTSDVLEFMADSLTLVGRDVLQPAGAQSILLPSIVGSLTKKGDDANKDKKGGDAGQSDLNVIGNQFDGFWKGIQDTLGAIPLIGKVVQTPINALRNSDPWTNDITRVLLTVGLFLAPLSPLAGVALGLVAGVVVAIGAFLVPALPILGVGLFGGLAAGFFAFGAGLVSGLGIITVTLLGFLLFFGGGIAMIVVGAVVALPTAGVSIALIVVGAILVLISPFILLGLAPGIGFIVGAFVGAVLLVIAGVVVMIIPAVIAGLIAAAVAGGLTLIIAIPVLAVIALVAGVAMIPAAFIVWAIQGSTRPANEKKPGNEAKPADKDKKAADKGPKPAPAPGKVPAPAPAPDAKKAKDKKADEKKANPANPWAAAAQSDFALAA